jgi:hypothetical protein
MAGLHVGHKPEAVIMDHVNVWCEFAQRAPETRRAPQLPDNRNARPIRGKATDALTLGLDVTTLRRSHRKQLRIYAGRDQRLAKSRYRVRRSAMSRIKSGDDMHRTQRAVIQNRSLARRATALTSAIFFSITTVPHPATAAASAGSQGGT